MEKKPLVVFDNVSLSYKTDEDIFYDLNLTFYPGSFYFLTGPSGSGKTSFLKLIYMDVAATQGDVFVFGRGLSSLTQASVPHLRQRIGMVFQDCYLLNHLTLVENVALPLKIRGLDESQARYNATEMLSWVGLGRYLNHYPEFLSGGQRQRAAIARAVINRPALLLADEPTGNVDKENATKILHLFEELNKRGTAIVFATHDRSLAASYSYPELLIKDQQIHWNERTAKRHQSSNFTMSSAPEQTSNVIIGAHERYEND